MSKIALDRLTSSFSFQAAYNEVLSDIEQEFSEKVLYRNNPVGEPNEMNNDLDMATHDILNVGNISANTFKVGGEDLSTVVSELVGQVEDLYDGVVADTAASAAAAASSASDALTYSQQAEATADQLASTVVAYTHEGTLLSGETLITLPWSYDTSVGVEVYLEGVKLPLSDLTFTSPTSVTIATAPLASTAFEVVSAGGIKSDFANILAGSSGSSLVGYNATTVAGELGSLNSDITTLTADVNSRVFKTDLANSVDGAKGAALVGYNGTTVKEELDSLDSAFDLKASYSNLADTNDYSLGSSLIGRSVLVLESIKDLIAASAIIGRDDAVVYVKRYWNGFTSAAGEGFFTWAPNTGKAVHDGGRRISPTVPWNGSLATHAAFLAGTGETAPGTNGVWLRSNTGDYAPSDYGANEAAVISDNDYIFTHFEAKWPNQPADLRGITYRVGAFPSGAKYYNGSFTRISDSKTIEPGWSDISRVGNRNTLVGRNTATNLTTNGHEQTSGKGYNLTALGDGALFSAGNNVKHNTAIGPEALYKNQYARYNIAIGLEAMHELTGNSGDEDIGSRNVVIGDNGGRFNQGAHNIAIGRNAMQCKTTGDYNIHIGSAAAGGIGPVGLDGKTIQNPFPIQGGYRVGIGMLSLNWAFADNAIGIGAEALENLKGGVNNCAVGMRSLFRLESNLSPRGTIVSTTAVGNVTWTKSGTTLTVANSGHTVSTGNAVAIIFTSGVPSNIIGTTQYLTVASINAGVSWTATLTAEEAAAVSASGNATIVEIYKNIVQTTQDNNTALGNLSGQALVSGTENTFIGQAAGYNLTSGIMNTALGRSALRTLISGSEATTLNNCTGVGYNTMVSGDNQVQLGNSSTTTYAYGAVQNRSDERDKTDIRDTSLGLDFIDRLRPVDFKWDYREDYVEEDEEGKPKKKDKDGSKKRKRFHHGLIAQEVKKTIEELDVEFGGFQDHSLNGGDDVLSLGYEEFIAPLIKAVQELSARVAFLEKEVAKNKETHNG